MRYFYSSSVIGVLSILLLASLPATADSYLIDPSGGSVLLNNLNIDPDNGVTSNQALGFSFTLFPGGANATTSTNLAASVNGFLVMRVTGVPTTGIVDSGRGFPVPSQALRMIAPYWDDLNIPTASSGIVQGSVTKQSTGDYMAVTWNVSKSGQSGNVNPTTNFQAAVFGNATTVRGFSFLANDIAFSYAGLPTTPEGGSAAIGLNSGTSNVGATLAAGTMGNDAQGRVTNSAGILLHQSSGDFILLRPDGVGGYVVSVQQIGGGLIPEPGALLLVGIGGLALLLHRKRWATPLLQAPRAPLCRLPQTARWRRW